MYRVKIGHAHIKVRDLKKATDFYTKLLNLSVTEKIDESIVFLSGNSSHHELALQNVGRDAPLPQRSGTGLYHLAFEVADKESFAEAFENLLKEGIQISPIDHRISWALYFNDPDGNGLEIYVDTREEKDGHKLWHGESLPLDPEMISTYLKNRKQVNNGSL